MSEKKKEPSAIGWLLDQAGEHRGQYAASVALAIAGVLCSVAPYLLL